ncbi:hypothetical protein LINPERPRIM_LOCUS20286 [Linum perenne]
MTLSTAADSSHGSGLWALTRAHHQAQHQAEIWLSTAEEYGGHRQTPARIEEDFSLKVPRRSGRNVDSHWVACRISLPSRTFLVQGCRFWIDVAAVSDGGYRRGSDSSVDEASWGSLSPVGVDYD